MIRIAFATPRSVHQSGGVVLRRRRGGEENAPDLAAHPDLVSDEEVKDNERQRKATACHDDG